MSDKNSPVVFFPKITKVADVVVKIRETAQKSTKDVIFSEHAEMRMQERDISTKQVLQVIRLGEQKGKVKWDSKDEPGWRCKFTWRTAGVWLEVVVKLVERKDKHVNLIITVISNR